MDTFIQTTKKMLNDLETNYHRKQSDNIILTLENLTASSSLLGFCSFAHKAGEYRKLFEKAAVDPVKFALIVSELILELKHCETEWLRVRDALPLTDSGTASSVALNCVGGQQLCEPIKI